MEYHATIETLREICMNGHGKISKTLSEQRRVTEQHIYRFKNIIQFLKYKSVYL